MLDVFITSRVRRKIVVVYAKYPDFRTHVRGLAKLIKEDPGNIQRELFDGSRRMFELADNVEKMITMCPCGSQAEFNGRFVDDTFHVGEPIVMIDNDEHVRYQSMCASCYLQNYNTPGAVTA